MYLCYRVLVHTAEFNVYRVQGLLSALKLSGVATLSLVTDADQAIVLEAERNHIREQRAKHFESRKHHRAGDGSAVCGYNEDGSGELQ